MKNLFYSLLILFFILSAQVSEAQTQPNSRNNTNGSQDSGLKFGMEGQSLKKGKKKKRKQSEAFDYNKKVREYEDRMEEAVARNKKMSKEMEKPQYSDHRYFGHKTPPKKNPVGKKKYCKVCGIRH